MPIKQFVLEPPLAIDWIHRPISSQVSNNKRKKNVSKLLILNDVSINQMLEKAKKDKVDVLLCSKQKCPELMLTPQVIGKNAELGKLTDAYLNLQLAKDSGLSRGTLMQFLRIMLCASDDTKNYGLLKTLKEWFQTPKEDISDLISKVKIKKKYEMPKIEQAKKMFSQSIDYTEGILSFLWKIHGANAWQESQKDNQPTLTGDNITVVPASIFKQNTYFYLLFIYGVICKLEVYIDTDVSFDLVSPYLGQPENSFSIARYANSKYTELAFLAANAQYMLSSAQIADQSLFFSWLASKDGDALQDYSISEMKEVLSKNPYVRFVGMYFTLARNKLSLTQYNLKLQKWCSLYFDLHLISQKTVKSKSSNINTENKAPSLDKDELKDVLTNTLKKEIKSSLSDIQSTLNLLCSKVDSANSLIDKNKKNLDKAVHNLSDNQSNQFDLTEIKELSDQLSKLLIDLPKSIDRRVFNFLEDYNPDHSSDEAPSPEKIHKEFNDALNQQDGSKTTDFDE
jgi:hypothetical protein